WFTRSRSAPAPRPVRARAVRLPGVRDGRAQQPGRTRRRTPSVAGALVGVLQAERGDPAGERGARDAQLARGAGHHAAVLVERGADGGDLRLVELRAGALQVLPGGRAARAAERERGAALQVHLQVARL